MREDPGKNDRSVRRKLFKAGVGFFVLVMLVTSFFGKKGYMDIVRTRRSLRALEAKFKTLEESKNKLETEIRELTVNPRAVEEEARRKLWLMKPDEKVIVLK
ncbi:MAG TPA: septum formation initiator family protein [Acidobacteriota bacterium]|nr:septum formation initiator family protein [Acidobacteriota bacterium]